MSDHLVLPTEAAAVEAPTAGADAADADHDDAIDLRISREHAEALLLAVDALAPLLERLRSEIAPAPEPESSSPDEVTTPDFDDALHRATRLARESLREARVAIGERRPTAEQRRAWQAAARRYVVARREGARKDASGR